MNKYTGKICPYCKAAFTDEDNIVICSECEMPHHRDCWIENQGCTTFGCNGTIQNATLYQTANELNGLAPDTRAELPPSGSLAYCPYCGVSHDSTARFCKRCGRSFAVQNPTAAIPSNNDNAFSNSFYQAPPSCPYCGASHTSVDRFCRRCGRSFALQNPTTTMPYNSDNAYSNGFYQSQANPTQGYVGEEKYIVNNVGFYKSKFNDMRNWNKKTSWNWPAFLFAPYWCFYRKMYGIGAGVLAGSFIFSLIGVIGWVILLAGCIVFGIFANYIYMQHIQQLITTEQILQEPYKAQHIQKSGGVNTLATVLIIIAYWVVLTIIYQSI